MNGMAIYNVLGIKSGATQEEIKAAYRVKAKESHPDLNPDDPDADERFRKVKKAYDLLSDDLARRKWHERYNIPSPGWMAGAEPKEEMPPEGLDRACIQCLVISHRCSSCRVGFCMHLGTMLKLEGHLPRPVCIECKKTWEEGKFADWKLKQMIKTKFGRMGL